jgi:serine/threonine protein kinase
MSPGRRPITVGQHFAGYRLDELVNESGIGDLYKAFDERLQRAVALRIVAPDLARDPVTRARLNRASTALAGVDHPNVIPIYEAGEYGGRLFIAVRWVDGSSLRQLVRTEGPLELQRAVRIVNQVASALQAIHDVGIVHRNVAPSSVLVTPIDHVYLIGFGYARRADAEPGLTLPHQLPEAVDYLAPEYIAGEAVDARLDIYGLGSVLYETLTGEVPYPAAGVAARSYAHLVANPPSARSRRPEVPEALDAVIRRAVSRDPRERQQSAGEFAIEAAGAIGMPAPSWATRTPPDDDGRPPPREGDHDYDDPVFYTARGRRLRRWGLWTLGLLLFLAVPIALLLILADDGSASARHAVAASPAAVVAHADRSRPALRVTSAAPKRAASGRVG